MSAPLYELAPVYAELLRAAEDGEDVETALAQITEAIERKADSIGCVLAQLEADAETIWAEEKRLAGRRRALESARERLRDYVRAEMDAHGITRIKTARFTLSVRDNPPSIVIVDEAQVPDQYVRITRVPDKTAIKRALEQDGEVVPGTRIERGRSLQIR